MPPAASAPFAPPPTGGSTSWLAGLSILGNISAGSQPTWATVDTQDNLAYVTNFGSTWPLGNSVSVLNLSNGSRVRDIQVGDDPIDSVYDPYDGNTYIMNFGTSDNVSVLAHGRSVGSVRTGASPRTGAYDAADHEVYVADFGAGNISLISGGLLTGSIDIAQGSAPLDIVYDPANHDVYVSNSGGSSVSVLNGGSLIANISVGSSPAFMTYDAQDGEIYVPNWGSGNVSVINGTKLAHTFSLGGLPYSTTYDPSNGEVYVPNSGTSSVDLLKGSSVVGNVSVGLVPRYAAYDPSNGFVYVEQWAPNQVVVLNGSAVVATIDVGNSPYSVTYDPGSNEVLIPNYNSNNVSIIGTPATPYNLSFSESGLPIGTTWGVQVGATAYSVSTGAFAFPAPNGVYNYSVLQVSGFAANATGTATVRGASVQVTIVFTHAEPITFQETGLPAGGNWTIDVDGVTNSTYGSSMVYWEANGTYRYGVTPIPGLKAAWNGTLTVAGSPIVVTIAMTGFRFALTFAETGLRAGTEVWQVEFNGSLLEGVNAAPIVVLVANGTYGYTVPVVPGYALTGGSGTVTVNGSAVSVDVTFIPFYSVTFEESGLPTGTLWTVSLGTAANSSTGTEIAFASRNGTLHYAVGSLAGFTTVWRGTLDVQGAALLVPVPFAVTTFPVRFTESGLTPGTNWGVTIGSLANRSNASTVTLDEPNGTWTYRIPGVPGYSSSRTTGSVTVDDGGASIAVAFVEVTYTVEFTESGLPSYTPWSVNLSGETVRSVTTRIDFSEPNGTYYYAIAPLGGYYREGASAGARLPWSGAVTILGANASSISVDYARALFNITFIEIGLPAGTRWSVTVGGTSPSSATPSIVVGMPNGTYPYTVGDVAGYQSPASGEVNIQGGAPAAISLEFRPTPSTFLGLPFDEGVGLVGGGVVAAVVILAALLQVRRRRSGRGPPDGEPRLDEEAGSYGDAP